MRKIIHVTADQARIIGHLARLCQDLQKLSVPEAQLGSAATHDELVALQTLGLLEAGRYDGVSEWGWGLTREGWRVFDLNPQPTAPDVTPDLKSLVYAFESAIGRTPTLSGSHASFAFSAVHVEVYPVGHLFDKGWWGRVTDEASVSGASWGETFLTPGNAVVFVLDRARQVLRDRYDKAQAVAATAAEGLRTLGYPVEEKE